MTSIHAWPDFGAIDDSLDQLAALSRYYGADPDFILAGGGNTSYKTEDRLYVKASGVTLADIDAGGFVELDRPALENVLQTHDEAEEAVAREDRFKHAVLASRIYPEKGQRPSVEALLHHLIPQRFVVHSHPGLVNMITCAPNGAKIAADLFGDDVLWLPYTTPGLILAKVLHRDLGAYAKRTGKATPQAILMGNHGLIIAGDTPDDIRDQTNRLCAAIESRLGARCETPFGPLGSPAKDELIRSIAPALRALLAEGETLKTVTFDDSPCVRALTHGASGRDAAMGGPLSPDQIVYCKSFPLWFEASDGDVVAELKKAVEAYREERGIVPNVVLVQGLGLFAAGATWRDANTVREVYADAIGVMAGAKQLDDILPMTDTDRTFIENWEVEHYRRKVAAAGSKAGRATGKVAIVTGAAQGFGLEIAEDLASEGAHVVLADINVDGVAAAAEALCATHGAGRALGVAINVTDGASIESAIDSVIRHYGGFDLFISNAGVLKAGSVMTQPEADFDFVTSVNYKGYFLCVKHAAPILARQRAAKADYWGDIIQINSKSGLEGSCRNGAYAGGKFGGIGLTQSFALELVEDGIKVNAICPGNFFDGSLWSEPENGLFAQYLRSGKVPGATTIEEVRHFYEAKVPMLRGCETADVMKAVYYVLEQRYETGQAIPVTGGQVMLS